MNALFDLTFMCEDYFVLRGVNLQKQLMEGCHVLNFPVSPFIPVPLIIRYSVAGDKLTYGQSQAPSW